MGKKKTLGREDVFLVHPQNGFNCLILNWCIDGCWFTPVIQPSQRRERSNWCTGGCWFTPAVRLGQKFYKKNRNDKI
jgi:hypothetical protein